MKNAPRPPLMLNVPEGDAAVPHTIAAMRVASDRLAKKWAFSLTELAHRHGGIFNAMKTLYRFARDPASAELIRPHDEQINAMIDGKTAYGDCDDSAVIIGAFYTAHRNNNRFVAVARSKSSRYEHVLCARFVKPLGIKKLEHLYPIDPQETDEHGKWVQPIGRAWIEGQGEVIL